MNREHDNNDNDQVENDISEDKYESREVGRVSHIFVGRFSSCFCALSSCDGPESRKRPVVGAKDAHHRYLSAHH